VGFESGTFSSQSNSEQFEIHTPILNILAGEVLVTPFWTVLQGTQKERAVASKTSTKIPSLEVQGVVPAEEANC